MKYVITGGAGFIGSNFIRLLLSLPEKHNIACIDKLTYASNINAIKNFDNYENYILHRQDICNQDRMCEIISDGDIVVNFAAESHVDNSIINPNVFLETNILGVQSLLSACRKNKAALFVQISTDEVYGSLETCQNPSEETDILCPSSVYSASKASAEMLCFAAMKTFNQPIIITRSSNNFGPYQHTEKLIPSFITKSIRNEKLPVYGNGQNIRDWIFVEDNCRAIYCAIRKGKTGEVYNIGGENEITNIDITKMILKKMNKSDSNIEFVEDRLGHDLRYALNCSKMKSLGWENRGDFEHNLDSTIKWYKENS